MLKVKFFYGPSLARLEKDINEWTNENYWAKVDSIEKMEIHPWNGIIVICIWYYAR